MLHLFENLYMDLIVGWAVIVFAVTSYFVSQAIDDIENKNAARRNGKWFRNEW